MPTEGLVTTFYGRGTVGIRTLLVKDTTTGADISDHVVVQSSGSATGVVGVLRRTISADLTIQVNLHAPTIRTFLICTIPAATPIDTPITFPAIWDHLVTYGIGAWVKYKNLWYISILGSNLNQLPDAVSSTYWTVSPNALVVGNVLSFGIIASDGTTDANGIASFTLEWSV